MTAQRTTSSDGSQSWAEYDRLNRETVAAKLALNGSWLYEQTLYDVLGRPYAKSQPFFAPSGISNATRCWTVNVLDLLGRPVREESNYVEAGGGSSCGSSPPIAGQGLSGSIRKSRFEHDVVSGDWTVLRVYENEHDAEARRYSIKAVDSLGHTKFVAEELVSGACAQPGSAGCPQIEYDQDAQGNATFIRRAGQLAAGSAGFVSATFETKAYFDARGFKRWLQDPDLGEWRYDYNGYGELNWQRDSKGQVTTVTYDVAGRMRSRTEGSEGTSYFNFDETSIGGPRAVGKLTSVTQPGGFEERHSFDTYGRPTTTKRRIDGAWQWVDMTYDSQSRLNLTKYPAWTSNSTETSAAPDSQRLIVRNVYNGYGYHVETINQTNGQSVWTVNEINQYGITKETLGNGVVTDRVFEASTGRLKRITSQKSGVGIANDLEFAFNRLESVTRRADYVVNRSESFSYDALARLKSSSLYSNAAGTGSAITQNFEYDVFGNIVSKGGAGALFDQFDYRGASGCSTNVLDPCKPGAVRSVRVNGGATRTMLYDRNGNLYSQTGGAFTSVDWTVANLARRITKNASEYAEFSYAPDRGRFKQVAVKATGTETTIYVAGLYERYSKGSVTEHSYYIKGGAGVVAIFKQTYTSGSLTATATRYLHRDHLGSVVVMTSESGVAVDRMSFDSWGKRRDASTWSSSAPGVLVAGSAFTTRGYTGHEQVDFVALVHMNGRIYDAEVGRFLSADPYVAFPDSTQGFNRFSYVDNNPLSFTDPSGFSKLGEFLKMVGIAIVSMYVGQSFYYLAGEGVNGAIAGGFMGGFTSGFLSSGGNFDAGLMSGLCGAITAGIGHGIPAFDKAAAFSNQAIAKALVHGAVQGVFNDAMGGDFGSGFMGGFYGSFFGEGFTSEGGPFDDLGPLGQATVASIIGGTGALIGGGKFANGAASAAFVSLFNQAMVPKKPPPVYTVDSEYNLETKVLRATLYADGVEVETIKFEAYSGGGHEPETEIIIWGDAKPLAKGVWRITENPSPRKRYFALFMEDGNVNDEFLDTDGQWREAIRFGIHSSRGSHGCIMIWDQSNNNPQRHQSNWDKYQKWIRMTKPTKLTYTNSVLDQKGTAEIRAYGTITVK